MILRVPDHLLLLEALEEKPMTFSELVYETGLPAGEVRNCLNDLLRRGTVVKDEYFYRLGDGVRA